MEKTYKKKYLTFLIGFFIGLIGFASAFFMYISIKPPIEINYDVGDISDDREGGLAFNSIDESIYLENIIPTLDKFGVEEKGFSFSIKNNNLKAINYELKLLDDNSTIPNRDIRYQLIKNNQIQGIYTLSSDGVVEVATIDSKSEVNYTIKLWLDYNSEIKVGELKKKISVIERDENDYYLNKPVLTMGMIPVYYDYNTNSWYKTSVDSNKWYAYDDGIWANVVTINSNKRKYYQDSEVDTKILMEDINSMWVWIPRFNYQINDDTLTFVNTKEKAYQAFTFNDIELDGFWFTKFESSLNSKSECITSSLTTKCNNSNNKLYYVPDFPLTTKMSMSNIFYAIRKMELKNNIYGFNGTGTTLNFDGTIKNDNNDFDIHMIKNSEWQAVSLLSSSKYGKVGNNKDNNKKVLNNNSSYSGKSYYEDNEYDYNVSIKGEAASTTGNVYGIYDMAGGKREYVMVNNSELSIFEKTSNSGFSTMVKEYYYDQELRDSDTTLKLKDKENNDNLISKEPITRGGYKNTGGIFNLYSPSDYINKVSVETNSRACLIIMKEKNDEKKES